MHFARHVAGKCQYGGVVTAGFIKTGDEMCTTGAGSARAHRKLAGELGLAGGGKCGAFFMADTNPFDGASTDRVGQGVE